MAIEKNVGMIDRIFRAIIGVLLFAAGLLYLIELASVAVVFIGLVLIVTALAGSCPLYSVLGIRTVGHPLREISVKREPEEKPLREMEVPVAEEKKPKKAKKRRRKKAR